METAKNFKGFTLIELLVGITITSIVFSVGYSGFREFSRRQALTGVTKTVVADLRQIQQLALTGQKPSTCSAQKLIGYTFARVDQDTYTLTANCTGNINTVTKTVDLNGVTFTATAVSTLFKILGQGTSLAADNNLVFTHIATGTTGTVTIRVGGDVQVQ